MGQQVGNKLEGSRLEGRNRQGTHNLTAVGNKRPVDNRGGARSNEALGRYTADSANQHSYSRSMPARDKHGLDRHIRSLVGTIRDETRHGLGRNLAANQLGLSHLRRMRRREWQWQARNDGVEGQLPCFQNPFR